MRPKVTEQIPLFFCVSVTMHFASFHATKTALPHRVGGEVVLVGVLVLLLLVPMVFSTPLVVRAWLDVNQRQQAPLTEEEEQNSHAVRQECEREELSRTEGKRVVAPQRLLKLRTQSFVVAKGLGNLNGCGAFLRC